MNLPMWGAVILVVLVGLLVFLSKRDNKVSNLENDSTQSIPDNITDVEGSIDKLKRGKIKEKIEAIEQLLVSKPDGLGELLVEAMADKNEEVKMAAAGALKELKDANTVPSLIKALREPDKWLPARVAEVLVAVGPAVIPSLKDAACDGNESVRAYAVQILGMLNPSDNEDIFIKALKDEAVDVRRAASMVLADGNIKSDFSALAEAAQDSDSRVRVQVARSLGKSGLEEAVPVLSNLAKDEDWGTAASAIESLAAIGGKAESELIKIAQGPKSRAQQRALAIVKKKGIKVNGVINISYGRE